MRALRRLFARTVNLAGGRRGAQRLAEEMREHLEQQAEENVRAGMTPAEAYRQARLKFGPVEALKESYRAEEGLPLLESLLQDVRYGARVLSKNRGFAFVAAISLALAIGANTTVFSVAKQLLYERLAVPHADTLRLLSWTGSRDHVAVHDVFDGLEPLPGGKVTSPDFSYVAYLQLRAHNQVHPVLGDMLAFHETGMNVATRDDAQRVVADEVSGNYYAVLGVQAQLGRGIEPADDTAASRPVVVISDEFWSSAFGRSPRVLGQWIRLNDVPAMIVGVNPRSFTGVRSVLQPETPSVTVPLALQTMLTPSLDGQSGLTGPTQWGVSIMAHARSGVPDSTAQAALDTQLSSIVRATMPVRAGEDVPRLVLLDGSRGRFEQRAVFARPLSVLSLFVGLVLLLACANIMNLMLARGAQRQREMSVRLALGAGRVRILRQMLIESLLLASLGGVGGLVIGYFGPTALRALTDNAWRQSDAPAHFDWPVFAFAAAVTVCTGILFGLAPAIAATRAEVTGGLKERPQTTTRRGKGMTGKALVVFQIALSTLLVIGAGLFIRTLAGLKSVDPGFKTRNLLLLQVPLPQTRYHTVTNIAALQQIEQAINTVPGVISASSAMNPYLSDDVAATDFLPEGEALDPNRDQSETYNVVGVHFFESLGIPILAGRGFSAGDTADSPRVGIINESLARTRFPHQYPIGRSFTIGMSHVGGHGEILDGGLIRVIGVCRDTLYSDLHEKAPAQFFVPYVQQGQVRRMGYVIRTHTPPETIVPALRQAVRAVDPELPLVDVRTQEEQIATDLQDERLFVTLTSGFGILALLLASVGVYGVMAYSVAQRTNEIGIRLALGAFPGQVLTMILREASGLTVAGVCAGVGTSFLLNRVVQSMLYGVAASDPATLSVAALLLLAVALAASFIPARRAASVQPMQALRRD